MNTYFLEPSWVLISIFFHFEPDNDINDFAILYTAHSTYVVVQTSCRDTMVSLNIKGFQVLILRLIKLYVYLVMIPR
jgi:hypothetical protein